MLQQSRSRVRRGRIYVETGPMSSVETVPVFSLEATTSADLKKGGTGGSLIMIETTLLSQDPEPCPAKQLNCNQVELWESDSPGGWKDGTKVV